MGNLGRQLTACSIHGSVSNSPYYGENNLACRCPIVGHHSCAIADTDTVCRAYGDKM